MTKRAGPNTVVVQNATPLIVGFFSVGSLLEVGPEPR
jgi:hypothetical protein